VFGGSIVELDPIFGPPRTMVRILMTLRFSHPSVLNKILSTAL
jgi:hypothetical protein